MPNATRHFFIGALLAGFAIVQLAAAQAIPQSLLDADKQECLGDCRVSGSGELVCQTLCSCSIGHFQTDLDLTAYQKLKAELERNELSIETKSFIEEVSAACVVELNNLLQQMGEPPQ